MFPKAPADALDLMEKLIVFNPNRRLTVEEALRHPYVRLFHDEVSELKCERKIRLPVDENTRFVCLCVSVVILS